MRTVFVRLINQRAAGLVVAGALVTAALLTAGSADAVVGTSGRFNLSGSGGTATLQGSLHGPYPWRGFQSFAYDNSAGRIYFAQTDGGTSGDLMVSETDLLGNLTGRYMTLRGFGHGTQIAVDHTSDGTVWLWTEGNVSSSGFGHAVARTPFVNASTVNYTDPQVQNMTPTISHWTDGGLPAIDPVNGRIAYRFCYQPTAGEPCDSSTLRYVIFSLADARAHNLADANRLAEGRLPDRGSADGDYTFQGFALMGQYIYQFEGQPEQNVPSTDPAAFLTSLDVNTSRVIENHVGTFAGYNTLGGSREPEGMSISVVGGAPRLAFGFSSYPCGTCNREESVFYKDDLSPSWSGWESLGGGLSSGPDAASWGPNRVDTFVVGAASNIYTTFWDGSDWSTFVNLGKPSGITFSGDPSAVSWASGRIDLFATGSDGNLWHKWYSGAWSGWQSLGHPTLGGLTSAPDAASWASGRLDVFARGPLNKLYRISYSGTWGSWGKPDLGTSVLATTYSMTSAPGAVSWGTNAIDVFFRGSDGALDHAWTRDGSTWGVEPLGGQLQTGSGPDAASWATGRIDVVLRGTDDALYHTWYSSGWSGSFENLGGALTSDPSAVSWGDHRIDTFSRGTDSALWHKFYG